MKKMLNILFLLSFGIIFAREDIHTLNTFEYSIENGYRDDTAYIDASSFSDWVYFSFEANSTVDVTDPSASLDWDMAFKRNHIKTNSGLSGNGSGGAYVDTNSSWLENWSTLTSVPQDATWQSDTEWCCVYSVGVGFTDDIISNESLELWGSFNANSQLEVSNYVMLVKDATGDISKFWPYDYYTTNAGGGHITIRYDFLADGVADGGSTGGDDGGSSDGGTTGGDDGGSTGGGSSSAGSKSAFANGQGSNQDNLTPTEQVIYISDVSSTHAVAGITTAGSGNLVVDVSMGSGITGIDTVDGTGTATSITTSHQYVQHRVALTTPFTVGLLTPNVDIAFGVENSLFAYFTNDKNNNGGVSFDCAFWAGEPSVSVTFK